MSFQSDNRSQAIQIGAVLIFGLIIVLLASYQAFVVPNQNAEIDFNHHQDVQRDMVELRAEILQAKTTGEDRFATVTLGTEYPSRIIAQNGPSPSGSLRTTDNRTIKVETGDGRNLTNLFDNFKPANKFIEFSPNYAQFTDASRIRYENTVVYQDFGDTTVLSSTQRLIRGDTISLIPVHRDYQASGRFAASIEPIPGILEREEVEDVNVTLGTELSQEDWRELMADEIESNDQLFEENITVSDGNLTLDLSGTFTLEYAPVGLDRVPLGGTRGDDALEINPAAPGDIELVASDWQGDSVTLTFKNNNVNANNSFSRGRIAFYDRATPSVTQVIAGGSNRMVTSTWDIPSTFEGLDPNIELPANDTQTVEVVFDQNLNERQEWFVLELRLETGQKATYFIGASFDNT
jgi:hypothetical protein